jgi:phosphoribosylformylglycinamidine synthase subunit PurS
MTYEIDERVNIGLKATPELTVATGMYRVRSPHCCFETIAVHYRATIHVTLRPSVLDPAGVAVRSGLQQLGHTNVANVRIGKYIELELDAANEVEAREQVDKLCDQMLANPVIEVYHFQLAVLEAAF